MSDRGGGPRPDPDRATAGVVGEPDGCPFPRPFDWHFATCPAFMPRLHLPRDIRGRDLPAHWTCAHLSAGRQDTGGFYARCNLGTAAERARWASGMLESQLPAIRLARIELSESIRPQLELVRQALGEPHQPLDSQRRNQRRAAWEGLVAAFEAFVTAQPGLFLKAGIEPAEIKRCFAEAMEEFTLRPGSRDWRMAESVVGRYPWPIVAFFRPDLVRNAALSEAGQQ